MPCGCRLEHKELEQMEPILNPKTGNFTAHTVLRFGHHKSISNDDSHPKCFSVILLIISNFLYKKLKYFDF